MENIGQVAEISPDVGRIRYDRVVSETTQGDHLPVSIKIVHNGTSFEMNDV